MEKTRLLFILLVISKFTLVFSQGENCKKCDRCDTINVPKLYLDKYTNSSSKIDAIKKGWGEFLGVDLDKEIPSETKGVHQISLKFDGLGCVYPDFINADFHKFFGINDSIKNKKFFKNTFFSITNFKFQIKNESRSFFNAFPKEYQNDINLRGIVTKKTHYCAKDYFNYMKLWNHVFLKEKISQINYEIKEKKIERVVILVHGYNLPYSLAHVQDNNIIDIYKKNVKDLTKTLFIKIFWPSLAKKEYYFYQDNFRFRNSISLESISVFKYITNRAYLVGLSLREVLNDINLNDKNDRIDIIGHSMGCPTIAAAIINPFSKMKITTSINKEFEQAFNNLNIPTKKINIFLNAPAMPGINTFQEKNFNKKTHSNIKWTIGYNSGDMVLRKTISLLRFGDQNGNTRLGGNWENETWKTKDYIKHLEMESNFTFVRTGFQYDTFGHDFFCYLHQKAFQDAFEKFIQ